jgi:DNA end-binding protein Ku
MKKPRASSDRKRAQVPATESMAANGRSLWTGQLRLALVSIPVQLVSAVKTGARLAFHQVDVKSHKRIKYEKIVPGIGRIDTKNIVKGFEVSKGQYVLVTEEDIESVKLEAKRTIDLIQFVDHCEVEPIYFDKPYFVIPDGKLAEEAYGVLRDALRASGKMGLGQFVMRGREYVAALRPSGRGLLLETLRFSDEVRAAAPFFADIGEDNADKELLDLATDLIKRKTQKFDPGRFHDHYTKALRELIESKEKNKTPVVEEELDAGQDRGNVVDLVAALRKSLQQNQSNEAPAKKTTPSGAKKRRL